MTISESVIEKTVADIVKIHGEEVRERAGIGIGQVATYWRKSDGSSKTFTEFCLKHFIKSQDQLDIFFNTFQTNLESLYGNLHKISRQFEWNMQIDVGPMNQVDFLFAAYDPFAHVSTDFFETKIAFTVLLNFSLHTLQEKNKQGLRWDQKKWAETRLVENFRDRIPAEMIQIRSKAYHEADNYINNYNIHLFHLLDEDGKRLFPEGIKLISHWGLRDEIKAQYFKKDGLPRQKLIYEVMKRIIRQEIPEKVINSNEYDWHPFQNVVFIPEKKDPVSLKNEPKTRYQHLLNTFHAEQKIDPQLPHASTLMKRRFNIEREMIETEVEEELIKILSCPVLKEIARILQQKLGRKLEPFDIWYDGFKQQTGYDESGLDEIVGQRYPTLTAFQENLPSILMSLGFTEEKARYLYHHIQVDPSRGAGHASGALMKEDKAHLRTRISEDGMRYKDYNIAIHELGHNVEQVFSLHGTDYYILSGVPNTAFTEAFAFAFQNRQLQIMGAIPDKLLINKNLRILGDFWMTYEISGVALLDMYIWRWLYENPNTSVDDLFHAVLKISKQVWNKYFAPIIDCRDQELLAIYSHLVDGGMYTPDYPMGHLISFQIEQFLADQNFAIEMERMCRIGRLSPQVWMQRAVGEKFSAKPLIQATEHAVNILSN